MENIRRNIKLFFTRYGNHLFIIIAVILGILLFLRFIDSIAEQNYKRKKLEMEEIQSTQTINKNVETEKIRRLRNKKISKDKKIIEDFLSLCEKNQQEAYNMLSNSCKMDKYVSFEEFKNNYIDIIFSKTKDYKIEEQEQDSLYKILLYVEDVLQAGSVENRKRFEDFYYIEETSTDEKKIYINYNN